MYREKTKAKKLQFFISKVQISKIEFKSMNGIKKLKRKFMLLLIEGHFRFESEFVTKFIKTY